MLIRPTPEAPAALEALLEQAAASDQVLALLKLGQRWPWVRQVLADRGLLDGALFAQRVGWPDQLVAPAAAVASVTAIVPATGPTSSRNIWPTDFPRRRTLNHRMMLSCTAPPKTAPIRIQRNPGR